MEARIVRVDALFSKLTNSFHRGMLEVLCVWLLEVGFVFKLKQATTTLAFSLLNTYLTRSTVEREQLQAIGVCCLSVAADVNEVYSPDTNDYVHICDGAYTKAELDRTKVMIVITLQGKIRPVTAFDVLLAYTYEEGATEELTHAQGLSLLLSTFFPLYFSLPTSQFAQVCRNAAKVLLGSSQSQGTDLQALHDLNGVLKGEKIEKVSREVLAATLDLLQQQSLPPATRKLIEQKTLFVDFQLPPVAEDCEEITLLGEGTHGTVHKVQCGTRVIAMKKQETTQEALVELSILATYRHENIIGFEHMRIANDSIELYLELGIGLNNLLYPDANPLHPEVSATKNWRQIYIEGILDESTLLPEERRHSYIRDICSGVAYLYQHGILHRDLKPGNVIIVDDTAKLADFGLALQYVLTDKDTSTKSWQVCSLPYRPPELLLPKVLAQYAFELDIWSLGALIAEIETNCMLFASRLFLGESRVKEDDDQWQILDEEQLEVMTKILGTGPYVDIRHKAEGTRLHCIRDVVVRNILLAMLRWVPSERITADEVYERFLTHF